MPVKLALLTTIILKSRGPTQSKLQESVPTIQGQNQQEALLRTQEDILQTKAQGKDQPNYEHQ